MDTLGSDKLPEFLRYYWNSKNKTIRKSELFKSIKREITDRGKVFELLRDLDTNVDIYKALLDPQDELWKEKKDISKYLNELKIFGAKQQISLLLSAYTHLDEKEFIKILKICSVIYFRYNVIGRQNPSEQESVFNQVAISISKNKSFDTSDFQKVYPNDEQFKTAFANKELRDNSRNRKVLRYIFANIEYLKNQVEIDYLSEKNTIEHILPENPDETWGDIEDHVLNRCRYRLGNLTLLEKSKNAEAKNKPYKDKKSILASSNFAITKSIPENYEKWGEDEIINRQENMAKKATSIWKLDL